MSIPTEVSETAVPSTPHGAYLERCLDPWHQDAFSDELKFAGTQGERRMGWMVFDWIENPVGWIPDGSPLQSHSPSDPPGMPSRVSIEPDPRLLARIYKLSYNNKQRWERPHFDCVCFHCEKQFRAVEVKDHTSDGCAICPHCKVDSVIVVPDLLRLIVSELEAYYFTPQPRREG